jgi:hypothetical protein
MEFEANNLAKKFCFGASGIAIDGLYNSQSISLICSLETKQNKSNLQFFFSLT